MKFGKQILFAQEGAPMPYPEEQGDAMNEQSAPVQEQVPTEGQQNSEQQLIEVANQLVEMLLQQTNDPRVVMMILQTAMEILNQQAKSTAPVMQRHGGRLVRIR